MLVKGKKLQETIFTLLEPYLDQNYHVYQDNYYNHVTIAETLLSRQVRVCGTIRVNRGHPKPLLCLMRTLLGDFQVICGNMCLRKLLELNGVKGYILPGGAMFVLPTKKRSETWYICKFCLEPLHKGICFQRYHTVQHYYGL